MNIPENPFRRKEMCGGCTYGLADDGIFDPNAISTTERSNRPYVVYNGCVKCSQIRQIHPRNPETRAQSDCFFKPSRYSPIKEGLSDRLCRYIITTERIVGGFLERVF